MTNPIIQLMCQKHGISTGDFFGKGRDRKLVACRTEAAQIFRDRGCSWPGIGLLLKRSPETIRYWLDAKTRARRIDYMRRRWHAVYKHQGQKHDQHL